MTVKTEISLGSSLFKEAESLARELNMSRSQLFSVAVQEFMERHETRRMMAAINEVHDGFPDEEEQATLRQMREYHRKLMRDDPW